MKGIDTPQLEDKWVKTCTLNTDTKEVQGLD